MPTAARQATPQPRAPVGPGATTSARPETAASNSAVEYLPAALRPSLHAAGSSLESQLLRQLRHDLEQVADKPEVRDLEDRRFLVLVDGNDRLRILHSG